MSELRERIHGIKPWVKFGVSPFAVWRNASTDPEGSDTEAGAETYDDLYADTRGWVRQEWVDYIAAKDVRADRLGGMSRVVADHYQRPALIPVSALLPGKSPDAPESLRARRTADGVALRWRGDGSSYAIYRLDGDESALVGAVHDNGDRVQRWIDTAAPDGPVTYAVTALDRTYRQGEPASVHVE